MLCQRLANALSVNVSASTLYYRCPLQSQCVIIVLPIALKPVALPIALKPVVLPIALKPKPDD